MSAVSPLHNLANISYKVIISEDLGVHIGVYHSWIGVHIGVYQSCPDLKRTLVAMSERTGLSISQVTDEVLYAGLIEMQELDELEAWWG